MSDPTPIFELADRYVTEAAALDPFNATSRGILGYEHLSTDYSPAGSDARAEHVRSTLTELRGLAPTSDEDRLAQEFMAERLGSILEVHESGEWMRPLRPIGSPVGTIRSVFDLMSRDGEEAWEHIVARVEAVPATLDGLRASLDAGRAARVVASQRQARAAAEQCRTWAEDRWFDTLRDEAAERSDISDATRRALADGVDAANAAYGRFADHLLGEYLTAADPADACGPERYAVGVRAMLGASLDPGEMYEWAWGEYRTLREEILRTCAEILPGATFPEVCHLLDHDPARAVEGEDAYQAWLQEMTDAALERARAHFDIPARMNKCEARIPPAGSAAAAYYTGPSEDFSRPGRTWYPALGRTSFPKWGDVTTCYHESVPGHHLQIAYAKLQGERLSRFQRQSFVSGHGEGWALYAERLCDELGWFELPEYRLGFLCGQQLRAVRVIIDIGMHLGMRIPAGTTLSDGTPFHAGEVWTGDLALEFSVAETGNTVEFMRSEVDRYLGWPAQAISYKIGEREWLAARADARERLGDAFDMRAFHTFALALGPVGLAQLRDELARFEPAS